LSPLGKEKLETVKVSFERPLNLVRSQDLWLNSKFSEDVKPILASNPTAPSPAVPA
jgi:hypothetical protein